MKASRREGMTVLRREVDEGTKGQRDLETFERGNLRY